MAVSVAAALLLGALFAGDSVWTALAALLVAGGWGALALAGRAPLPAGGGVLARAAARDSRPGAGSRSPGRSRPTSRGSSSTGRSSTSPSSPSACCSARGPRRAAKLAAAALIVAFGAGVVWALAGKAIPALFPDGGRAAGCATRSATGTRSRSPPTCCSCSRSRSPPRRERVRCGWAARCSATRPSSPSSSPPRAPGVAAAVLGIVLWLWLRRDRVEAALLALVAIVPAAARRGLGVHADRRSSRTAPRTPTASPTAPGSGCSCVVGGALVAVGARELARRPLSPARRRRVARLLRGFAFAVALVTVVGLVANAGRIADEFRGEEVQNDPGPVREPELEQPAGLVGRGARHLRGRPARRRRREHVRGGAEALPRDRLLGDPAAQRPAPVPRRDRARRAGALRSGSSPPRRRRPSARCVDSRARARCRGGARRRARALARARARRLRLGLRRGHRPRLLRRRRARRGRTTGRAAARSRSPRPRRVRSRSRPRSRSSRPGSPSGASARSTRRSSAATSTRRATPPSGRGR